MNSTPLTFTLHWTPTQSTLNWYLEITPRLVKHLLLSVFLLYSATCSAENIDPSCLNHLGGAFAGIECYNGLTNNLREENKQLFSEILSAIPPGNNSRVIFRRYMKNEAHSEAFCALPKDAYLKWKPIYRSNLPRYHDFDVVYYECIYSRISEQNRFLKKLKENLSL